MPIGRLDASKKYPMSVPDGQGGLMEIRQLVHLNQVIDHPRIEIGDFTYYHHFTAIEDYAAQIAPFLFPLSPERLRVGKFCQFAHGVRFITSSANHDMSGFSTYPFDNFLMTSEASAEDFAALFQTQSNKGDTVVGNDVWLGYEAMVMPGVSIGDGAIIAAGSVVVQDVAAYTVVGGNPARELKCRFSKLVVESLLAIKWWDWPNEKIQRNLEAIRSNDIQQLERAASVPRQGDRDEVDSL